MGSEEASSNIVLRIEGGDADSLSAELSELLEASVESASDSNSEEGPRTRAFDLSLAAFFLSIPGAALATADLAARLEVRKKVDQLLEWARKKARERPAKRIEILDARGQARRLDELEAHEVMEITSEVARLELKR